MSRRKLSSDERTLWYGVTRSIVPFPNRRADDAEDAAPVPPKAKPKLKAAPKAVSAIAAPVAPRSAPRPEPRQTPVTLGRKAKRRLARGSDSIDGRLDLHGLTQAEAYDALFGFLRAARSRGARVVLVITGKGSIDAYEGRGVLKRQVPMWLRLPELRDYVVGFETAGHGHGGEGAMYVRLKRARE